MLQLFGRRCQKTHALLQIFVKVPLQGAILPEISRNAAFFRQTLSETASIAVFNTMAVRNGISGVRHTTPHKYPNIEQAIPVRYGLFRKKRGVAILYRHLKKITTSKETAYIM
ncbi:MAG: hypothetical protein IJ106_10305 [Parasporobacterium sp.]|nr:hypothetical protein [Parasporobacterium sp.]